MVSSLGTVSTAIRLVVAPVVLAVVAASACAEGPDASDRIEPAPASTPGVDVDGVDGGAVDGGRVDTDGPAAGPPDEQAGVIDEEIAAELDAADVDADDVLIPGLDSEDRFCRSWSRFTGTFQVLSVSAAFGVVDDDELLRREVISAGTTIASGAELVDAVADLIESEAAVVSEFLVAPYSQRASDAVEALIDAGASPDDLEALDTAWLSALETYDAVELELDVELDSDRAELVDRAARSFGERRPGWFEDTELDVEEYSIALTLDYAVTNCPDAGALAGLDAVD